MEKRIILDNRQFDITIKRLCYQLIENHDDFKDTVLVGLQPRGIYLAKRVSETLSSMIPGLKVPVGNLDITFFRDDFRRREEMLVPSATQMDFLVEDKKVVLVDDVLFTGRTIRSGMDAILAFGRPRKMELLCLIDRKYSRHLPIEPDYVGKAVDTINAEKVKVDWKETGGSDIVILFTPEVTEG